jgi:hypothetical protein
MPTPPPLRNYSVQGTDFTGNLYTTATPPYNMLIFGASSCGIGIDPMACCLMCDPSESRTQMTVNGPPTTGDLMAMLNLESAPINGYINNFAVKFQMTGTPTLSTIFSKKVEFSQSDLTVACADPAGCTIKFTYSDNVTVTITYSNAFLISIPEPTTRNPTGIFVLSPNLVGP